MKKFSLLYILLMCAFSVFAQESEPFTLKGILSDDSDNGAYAYLAKASTTQGQTEPTIDSAKVVNRKFEFNGVVKDKHIMHNLTIEDKKAWLVLEPGEMEFTFKDAKPQGYACVTGTPMNDQIYNEILLPSEKIGFLVDSVMAEMKTRVEEGTWTDEDKANFTNYMLPLGENLANNFRTLIKANADNHTGEYFLLTMGYNFLTDEDFAEISPKLSEEAIREYKALKAQLEMMKQQVPGHNCSDHDGHGHEGHNHAHESGEDYLPKTTIVGKQYADFNANNVNGKSMKFSEIVKGKKLILIDFWASWCMPCIKEMPLLIDIYNKNKDKNFEIVGVSLDENKAAWKKAIIRNKMTWVQLLNVQGEGDVGDLYGIRTIPYTILIDESGKIIARGLRGKELQNKIEELLK